jgi:hypothetical protein
MSSIYVLNISASFTGLCNQLNFIINSICYCINKEKIIVVNNFLQEIYTNNYTSISNILELEKINIFLEKYNVALIDANNTNNLSIISAFYYSNNKEKNVTDIINTFLINNTLFISKDINLNSLFEDIDYGFEKKLKIKFMLTNNSFTMSFSEKNEFLENDIHIDFNNMNFNNLTNWDLINSPEFIYITTDICNHLFFHESLINNSNNFIQSINIKDTCIVNIIHLRLESDAIQYWSHINNLNEEDFTKKLSEKYIEKITQYINKLDKTIILTYNDDNEVINYLKNNEYNYFIHNKIKNNNREVNAVIDIINAKYCNNIFIAVKGSTFSETISKIIKPKFISWIDINNI